VLVVQEAQPATTRAEEVLRALLSAIELRPDDKVAAGSRLDLAAKEDLRAALDGNLSPILSSPGYLIAYNIVTIDDVWIDGQTATVRVTYGPVPRDPRRECGQRITFVLKRATTWTLAEDETWVECAFRPARVASEEEETLREVFRLAMTEWGVGPEVKVVAGSKLSPIARRVLAGAGRVYSVEEVRTSEYAFPRDTIQLDKLTITADIAEVRAWKGPLSLRPTHDCGTGLSVRMRRRSEGWTFLESSVTVC
jgi:hypothetical protein